MIKEAPLEGDGVEAIDSEELADPDKILTKQRVPESKGNGPSPL